MNAKKILPHNNRKPAKSILSSYRRISLVTIFSSGIISILALFMLVNVIVIYRFVDFQSIITQLSGEALPKINQSGQTFSQVNQLTYLTARLAGSPSQAFRRIAYQDIENKIKQITSLAREKDDDQYLKAQLNAISKEFSGFNLLIEKRIQLNQLVQEREKQMYQIYSKILAFSAKGDLETLNAKNVAWFLNFSEITSLSGKALAMNRLSQVRQSSKNIKQKIELLIEQSRNVEYIRTFDALKLSRDLEEILVSESGLIPTKIKELRSIGQTTGRNNFVHNLVGDYARQIEYRSYEITELVIDETVQTGTMIKEQTKIILTLAVFSILFLIGIVYYLRDKIILRLVELNRNVINRLNGGELNLNIRGNDEISDIGHSFNYLVEEIERQKNKLQELSLTDGLTGIANRRYLDKRLTSELQLAQRQKLHTSILMMDVDFFKEFNDHYGHLAGDDCLKMITLAFEQCMQRKSDFVARFGGEEFVCILPDTNSDGADSIAKSILASVLALKIPHGWNNASPFVTISIGVATYDPATEVDEDALLRKADDALFHAKGNGKNCFMNYIDSENLG